MFGWKRKTEKKSNTRSTRFSSTSSPTQPKEGLYCSPYNEADSNEKKESRGIKLDLLVHDLKVPLAVIEAGVISLLQKQEKYGKLTEKQERVLKRVLRNTKITQTLVGDILELGRSKMGIRRTSECTISFLVKKAFEEILDLVEGDSAEGLLDSEDLETLKSRLSKKGYILDVDKDSWKQKIKIDVPKVSQILRNLLTNAIKYKKKYLELSIRKKEGYLYLSVKDDGEGIPMEFKKKIFDKYFQLEPNERCVVRGHGIGLAGALILTKDLGGEMDLESEEGKGTTFSVKIPI